MPNSANDLSGRVGLDTTDFKTGMSAMNRELRVLESSFRASAAGLGDWAKDASGLEMRVKSLNSQIDIQKQKVGALTSEYQRVAAESGNNSRAAQELQIKLNKETETLGKMESELSKTESALSEMGDESGQAAKETDRLEKEENQATGATNKFASALNALGSKLKAGVTGIGNMAIGVGKLAAKMAVGLAAGAVGATAGIGALVVKTAKASDELVETSEKLGITTTRLQELNYIAEQTGTGVDTIQSSMGRLVRNLDAIEKAGSPANDAMSKLGVSVRDSSGQLKDSETIFFEAIAALGGIANETERDELAMTLFGKSAMELNPLINLGTEGMTAMAAEAQKLGAIMSEETVAGMGSLNDQVGSLKAGFMGLVGTTLSALLPSIQVLIGYITDVAIPWLKEHLPAAIQVLKDYWTNVLLPAITAVWGWMSTVLIPFLQNTVFPWLQVNIPKALQTLSDFWTTVLYPAILAVWNWMSTVLIPFLQNTVFPWLETNIPKALTVLSDVWTGVLLPAITAVWSWISTVLIPFFESVLKQYLNTNIPAWIKFLSDAWNNVLLPALKAIWEFIDTYLVPIFKLLQDIFEIGLHLAITVLAGLWQNILLPALKDVWEFLDKYLTPAFTWFKDNVIEPLAKSLGTGLKNALEWVRSTLEKLKKLFDTIQIPDWLTPGSPTPLEMGIRGINDALQELNNYSLPTLGVRLNGLSGVNGGAGAFGRSVINNNWNYVIQAANPLQTSGDLARQVRLLELMH
jgi:hypothetical protein